MDVANIVILNMEANMTDVTSIGSECPQFLLSGVEVRYLLFFSNGESVEKERYFLGDTVTSFDEAHNELCKLWNVKGG